MYLVKWLTRGGLQQDDAHAARNSSYAKQERRLLEGSVPAIHESLWVDLYDDPPAGCHEPPDFYSGMVAPAALSLNPKP